RAIVVEGYLDCLMAHQHGFTETVAALGTAFTAAQLGLLRRYADEVVSVFDADPAGAKATSPLDGELRDRRGLPEHRRGRGPPGPPWRRTTPPPSRPRPGRRAMTPTACSEPMARPRSPRAWTQRGASSTSCSSGRSAKRT